jgi:PAS domain S-box-containing protein
MSDYSPSLDPPMAPWPLPPAEEQRIEALRRYRILDTLPEASLDDITRIAAYVCGTPIALISLIDTDRQWFKARIGMELTEVGRESAFCARTICSPHELMIVPDTQHDPRFATNPFVVGPPFIRFYAGAPLVTADGHALGTLCVIDTVPRNLTTHQCDTLAALSRSVVSEFELRRITSTAADQRLALYQMLHHLSSELDPDLIIQQAVQAISSLHYWRSISISCPSADGQFWQTRAEDQMEPGMVGRLHPITKGVIGRAYRTRSVQLVADTATDPDFFPAPDHPTMQSELAVPICVDQQVLGVLNLESDRRNAFTSDDVAFAQSIAEILAIALQNARRYQAHREIELALRLSEERYRRLFTTMSQGVVYQAADGTIIDANPAAERVLGLTLDQMQGRTSRDPRWKAIRPDGSDFPGDEHPAMIALRTGQPVHDVVMGIFNPHTEQHHWLQVSAIPLLKANGGEPEQVYATFEDITERRRAELALQASEELYRGLIESIDSVITTLDPHGTFLYVNDVAARLLARPATQIIGTSLASYFPPAIVAEQQAFLQQVITQDAPFTVEVLGLIHHVQRWYRISFQPIHDEFGQVVAVLVNATDIHDLKLMQQELLDLATQQEQRIAERTAEVQDLYDNAPVGYLSLDVHGRIMRINQTALDWLGYAQTELIGQAFSRVLEPASRAMFSEQFVAFKTQGRQHNAEYQLLRKNGTTLPILYSATALYTTDGQFVSSRSTMVDHTERKQAEAVMKLANSEMQRALRTKDEFLANMSHELRTPLNAILALSESLLEGIGGPLLVQQRESLQHIESSGHHLLALINDILDLSKVEAGRLDLQIQPMLLSDICQSSLQFVRETALKKGLQLSLQIPDLLIEIEADPKRLKQILVNLLSNAVKFTPVGGRVVLEANVLGAQNLVQFTIHDSGIGIAPDDLANLFQPFTQLDSSLSRQHEGTGLGLALVRRLVELHGGQVLVESSPGHGSQFSVLLPYNNTPIVSQRPTLLPVIQPQQVQVALIVDDSPSTADQLTRYLQELQIYAVVHRQGMSVVDLAVSLHPDLILLDLLMPEQSGWTILEQLQAHPQTQHIPVIIISVLDEPRSRDRSGVFDYLVKPISRDLLRTTIKRLHAAPGADSATPLEPTAPPPTPRTVLVAEDNQINLEVVQDYLLKKGYRVVVAHDGHEALTQAEKEQPDLIVMDIQMPHMDGLLATQQLRAMPNFAQTPIIALTALAMPGDRERCLEAGANAYLTKPVSLRSLAETMQRLLQNET